MSKLLLTQALNVFDPRRPLSQDKLEAYYVQRPSARLAEMKAYLLASDQPVKILFSGHRGSGKSTELSRLTADLENDFFIVKFSIAKSFNLPDIDYVDVALACAISLFQEATKQPDKIAIPQDLCNEVFEWLTKEVTVETTISSPNGGVINAKLNALIVNIEGKYGKESATRKTVRENLHHRVNDLILQTNTVCEEIYRHTSRRPLIVIEDLDKLDQQTSRDLFFNHCNTLNSIACHTIYTFPISLVYANEFTDCCGYYSHNFLLPNISLRTRQGHINEIGRQVLTEAITRRVSIEIFDATALDEIIDISGGLMRDLVRLTSHSALIALTEGANTITRDMVLQAGAEMTNNYRRLLLPRHYEDLRVAKITKQITPTETVRELLQNLSLLEYLEGETWGDVHPAASVLL